MEEIIKEEIVTKDIKLGMSANTLKFIAIGAMLLDHIAWRFVPLGSVWGQVMHSIGRITMPIMCYFIAEGYHHTSNMKKYVRRLAIFAVISHVPYVFFQTGKLPISFTAGHFSLRLQTSVIYTLLLGLIALIVWNNKNLNKCLRVAIVILLCLLSLIGDWPIFGVLWVLFFGINYGDLKKQIKSFFLISLILLLCPIVAYFNLVKNIVWWEQIFMMAVLLAIPLIYKYNGHRGGSKNSKWIFYIFYPVHLLILGIIKYMII